ncbi:hypothetical protein BJX62DRAFT_205713 [Aspergillus germanicus]
MEQERTWTMDGRSFPLFIDIQLTLQGRRDPVVPMCSCQIRNKKERCTPAEDGSFLPLTSSAAMLIQGKSIPTELVAPSLYKVLTQGRCNQGPSTFLKQNRKKHAVRTWPFLPYIFGRSSKEGVTAIHPRAGARGPSACRGRVGRHAAIKRY